MHVKDAIGIEQTVTL